MPVTGEGRMEILVVAEAPGEQEDKENTQLIGPAGQVLREVLEGCGVDLDRDFRKTNAVRCRPPHNRKPTRIELQSCRQHVLDEIKERKPRVVLVLGQVALESLLKEHVQDIGPISRWRGRAIPDQVFGCWICPTFHPSYILRSREGRSIRGKAHPIRSAEEMIFEMDIVAALEQIKVRFPTAPCPKIVDDWNAEPGMEIAIDYETTGIRPYAKGHRILTAAISNGKWACSAPMDLEMARRWKKMLTSKHVGKIAHNIKFEHAWAAHCLGTETQGWVWDTFLAAHLLDNRRGACKLKHQAYITFGVPNWEQGIKDTFDEGEDGFNRASVTPDLLRYNALDAFYTSALAQHQRRLFR